MSEIQEVIKRRVVGAGIILLALGLLVAFLVSERQARTKILQPIPPKPLLPSVTIAEPTTLHIRVEDMVAEDLTEDSIPSNSNQSVALEGALQGQGASQTNPESPLTQLQMAQDNEGRNVAWTLRVGSFRKAVNASQLRDKLRGEGFKAYVKPNDNGSYHRVFIGPELNKADMLLIKAKVDRSFSVDSQILRFRSIAR